MLLSLLSVQESASVRELAILALDSPDSGWSPSDGPKQELAQFVVDLLTSKADMLSDYFSLEISKVASSRHIAFIRTVLRSYRADSCPEILQILKLS